MLNKPPSEIFVMSNFVSNHKYTANWFKKYILSITCYLNHFLAVLQHQSHKHKGFEYGPHCKKVIINYRNKNNYNKNNNNNYYILYTDIIFSPKNVYLDQIVILAGHSLLTGYYFEHCLITYFVFKKDILFLWGTRLETC